MTDKRFPLYPELPEEGERQAQVLIDRFKKQMKKVADEVLGQLYCDVAAHIKYDAWTNFRNDLMDGFRDYTNNRLVHGEYDFKAIREKIYADHRAAIIQDLNQDNLKKIDELQKEVSELRDRLREAYERRY